MGDTSIEWTRGDDGRPGKSWNPIRGCSVVSEGCRNCYAMQVAARFSSEGQAYEGLAYRNESGAHWSGKVKLVEEHLEDPLRWKRPRRIFVNSMSDLFHESLTETQIQNVFSVMESARHHVYQILTKRPQRMLEFVRKFDEWLKYASDYPGQLSFASRFPHVWLGVSVEDQKTADERIPLLLETPAAVRWISAEPLLGPVRIRRYLVEFEQRNWTALDWVVVGGESGPNARPMHPDWARSLRDQCVAAGVPFFFKQWGEFKPLGSVFDRRDTMFPVAAGLAEQSKSIAIDGRGTIYWNEGDLPPVPQTATDAYVMSRVGKKAAGRLLDGREWNQYPEAKAVTV